MVCENKKKRTLRVTAVVAALALMIAGGSMLALAWWNNQSADVVIGQSSFTTASYGIMANMLYYPSGVHSDGTKLYIADQANHRVLIYNTIPGVNNPAANVVVGQPNMTSNTANNGGIGANAASYTADWGIDWSAATQGYNFISVRAFDNAANVSAVATDAFYVKKDTIAPVFAGLASATDTWLGDSVLIA